jgi:hypothetical protein
VRLDGCKVFHDLEEMSASDLCHCLNFLADIRKEDGSRYPPKSLNSIYAMIQHYLQYECNRKWSLFKSEEFKEARDVLDAEMMLSAREGNVKVPKRADLISFDDLLSLRQNFKQ